MASHQIQFQQGMSIPEFLARFGSEAQCVEGVKAARWPTGFHCPRCDSTAHYVVGHGARKLFQCNGCRHQTSLTAGSLMEHTKLPLRTWFLAIYLLSQALIVATVLTLLALPAMYAAWFWVREPDRCDAAARSGSDPQPWPAAAR